MLPVSQPDTTLSDQKLSGDNHLHDHCGVFGVWAPGEDVSRLTYFSLYTLQHHSQQSAGTATSNGKQTPAYKDQGLVSQVLFERSFQSLRGHIVLRHVRYATTGVDVWRNIQPMLGPTPTGTLALAHNDNLTNIARLCELAVEIVGDDEDLKRGASADTSPVAVLPGVADRIPGPAPSIASPSVTPSEVNGDEAVLTSSFVEDLEPTPFVDATLKVPPRIKGMLSLVSMDENTLYATRDPYGYHPLVLGHLASGWAVASETAALSLCGVTFVREVEPGEPISIDASGVYLRRFTVHRSNTCVFEYMYLARPDTMIGGCRIVAACHEMGAALAHENPIEADLVIPTPGSGTPTATGYVQESGIPFVQGLVKNAYMDRTLAQPTQSLCQLGIHLELNPPREVIEGKRLVVVDDSIVRSNTQRALVRMLCEAGAVEVHTRISPPPVLWPRFLGTDFPTCAELIISSTNVEQVRESTGADSLAYLSIYGMVGTTRQGTSLCIGCFTDEYLETIPAGTPMPGTPDVIPC